MSIQSDIEMLSVQAMEIYAARNNLTPEEVYRVFCKHQIFEKIILQHEYLHQVSLEEAMELQMKIDFKEAVNQFYHSETYLTLQNTENGLWAESPEYIADRFFEEKEILV